MARRISRGDYQTCGCIVAIAAAPFGLFAIWLGWRAMEVIA